MLTERIIRDTNPGPKPVILWDSQVAGLGCKVFPSGRKAFVLSYRIGGRKRLATLAQCSGMSLRAAREKASKELVRIRDGEADPLERRRQEREAPTVSDALERFFTETAPARIEAGRMTRRTVDEYGRQARRYVKPALGSLQVAKVTRHHVEKLVTKLAKTPALRNRVLAFLSRIFTLTEHWEWRAQQTNPVRGVERAREQARDRVLAPSELASLSDALKALEKVHPFPVAAIRVAALTGLRISECLSMQWQDIDSETGRVVLPSTKTGRRVVPLAAPVLELLARLPHVNECPWVFAAGRGAHVSYKTARDVFAKACEHAGLPDVRLHDLRRSLATALAGAGVNAYVLRDVLGHSTLEMANRYVRRSNDALTDATEQAAAITATAMAGRQPRRRRHGR